jgi:hypothetical protein
LPLEPKPQITKVTISSPRQMTVNVFVFIENFNFLSIPTLDF